LARSTALPATALRFLHHHRRGQFIVFLAAGMGALQLPDFGRQLRMTAELQFVDTLDGVGSADVFTKLYFADISSKFRSGTLRGTRSTP
jgi:hypothetical protein